MSIVNQHSLRCRRIKQCDVAQSQDSIRTDSSSVSRQHKGIKEQTLGRVAILSKPCWAQCSMLNKFLVTAPYRQNRDNFDIQISPSQGCQQVLSNRPASGSSVGMGKDKYSQPIAPDLQIPCVWLRTPGVRSARIRCFLSSLHVVASLCGGAM
jgi:hypothetical protein